MARTELDLLERRAIEDVLNANYLALRQKWDLIMYDELSSRSCWTGLHDPDR